MASITIGVPVYNGSPYLKESLECLRGQTFQDFEVLIFDNASSDSTPQIAAEIAAQDGRFRYFRQAYNKGPVANFHDVLMAAESRYFLWRAADDFSDPDFLSILYDLLESNPDKDLAVGCIVSRKHDGTSRQVYPFPRLSGRNTVIDRLRQMFGAHASWIYGLFRREALIPLILEVTTNYPDLWGWDYVTLFPLLLDGGVIGTNATHFEQGLDIEKKPRMDRKVRSALKIGLRAIFLSLAVSHVQRRFRNPLSRRFFIVAAWFYANKRICSFPKVVRGRFEKLVA